MRILIAGLMMCVAGCSSSHDNGPSDYSKRGPIERAEPAPDHSSLNADNQRRWVCNSRMPSTKRVQPRCSARPDSRSPARPPPLRWRGRRGHEFFAVGRGPQGTDSATGLWVRLSPGRAFRRIVNTRSGDHERGPGSVIAGHCCRQSSTTDSPDPLPHSGGWECQARDCRCGRYARCCGCGCPPAEPAGDG